MIGTTTDAAMNAARRAGLGPVETLGLDRLHEPHAKHLVGKLWELRVKSDEGIARGIYVALAGRRVVVLHVFHKKSQKTPRRSLDLARSRMEALE